MCIRDRAIADLFILPSETESFGLAALEAMACEVPVISTNTGGIPEINIQGVTGYLSNVGDVDDMAKNALLILKDEETLKQFKKNAIMQANKFSLENICLLYTSDAADERSSVDLGGRRIIKKKKNIYINGVYDILNKQRTKIRSKQENMKQGICKNIRR